MNVLVTGGCGFIGTNLLGALIARGHGVVILDNLSGGETPVLPPSASLYVGDVRDPEAVAESMKACDAVVHLAALASVRDSIRDPLPTLQVNVHGTVNVLRAAVDAKIRKFLFASSNAVVGDQPPPATEELLPMPMSPYGATKVAGESYCHSFRATNGLQTVCLRFANVYGPHSGRKSSVVAKFIKALMSGRPLTIYGDGAQTRDFVYVHDVANAIVLGLESERAAGIYQIGSGVETSILELCDHLASVSGRGPIIENREAITGEIRRNFSAIGKAQLELGFKPNWDLPAGLAQTWRWFGQASPRDLEVTASSED